MRVTKVRLAAEWYIQGRGSGTLRCPQVGKNGRLWPGFCSMAKDKAGQFKAMVRL